MAVHGVPGQVTASFGQYVPVLMQSSAICGVVPHLIYIVSSNNVPTRHGSGAGRG